MAKYNNEIIGASFVAGGEIELNTSWYGKNVVCPESKLFYILDGELIVKTEEQTILAKKGDMVLIPSGIRHDFYLSEKKYAKKFWFHFDMRNGNGDYFDKITLPMIVNVGKSAYIEKIFRKLFERVASKEIKDKTAISGIICSLVAMYEENCPFIERSEDDNEISKIKRYIRKNYSKNFTLSELSNMANLSENYFVRKFKENTGFSPMHYVMSVKIEIAKFMLENKEDSITQIMESVGFLDSAHFSKTFKMFTGHSPKKYREIYINYPFNSSKISKQ